MPTVIANGITMNYEQQGSGEPLVLIPYLAANHACYAFQWPNIRSTSRAFRSTSAEPAQRIALTVHTLPKTSQTMLLRLCKRWESGGPTSRACRLVRESASGWWRNTRKRCRCGWPKSDPFIKTVLEGWQTMAKALNSVQEMVIRSILPWCLMPELYAAKPEFVQSLADFARSRPPQSVASFIQQSNAVLAYDAEAQLRRVTVPTSTTFGLNDMVTSTRFASRLKEGIPNSEVLIFEECAHAPIYEKIEEFNGKSLNFMKRHARVESSQSA